jgi:predicted DNA-binding protein (MmcQ/YjbR family)
MTPAALGRLRTICLALPEAAEKETWENPTFRIHDKIFAMVHPAEGRTSVWCKAPPGAQTVLVAAAPEWFFRPPYVGHKGWIGIWLDGPFDDEGTGNGAIANGQVANGQIANGQIANGQIANGQIDWEEVADLIRRSYRMTAPKRLLKTLPD